MQCWGAGCYKWYQSRTSRLRVRVSVRAYGAWRVCARVGTHDMAYGVGTGRAGVRQGGTFLDIFPVWVSWTDEDVGFFEGVCDIWPNLDGLVVAQECCMHMFSTILLVEQGWSQLISLCPPARTFGLTLLREARTKA